MAAAESRRLSTPRQLVGEKFAKWLIKARSLVAIVFACFARRTGPTLAISGNETARPAIALKRHCLRPSCAAKRPIERSNLHLTIVSARWWR